jgi:hypothetical protein
MPADLYFSRHANPPDVWVYDQVPAKLRVQVSHIVEKKCVRNDGRVLPLQFNTDLPVYFEGVAHEHGHDALTGDRYAAHHADVHGCIQTEPDLNV